MHQMNAVQKNLYDKVVAPAMKSLAGFRIGEVRDINYATKRATIVYTDAQDKKGVEIINVPMVRQQGTHEAGPFIGDQVLIAFFNNDNRRPVIIGTIDVDYDRSRGADRDPHPGKGANVSDVYCTRDGEKWDGSV